MSEQNSHYNNFPEANASNFWFTHPPPPLAQSRPMTPNYNLDYRMPFIRPFVSSNNRAAQTNPMVLPYNCNVDNLKYQDQYVPYNQNISSSFPPLPDNIDEEYILKYVCPLPKVPKDEVNIWIENWLASKKNEISTDENLKPTNVKINEISNYVKKCHILLENMNNNKHLMKQNLLTMTETEWKKICSNLLSDKERLDTLLQKINLDENSLSELKFKIAKRKKKRNRLKRLKSDLKLIKSQQKDEIKEVDRKIDIWQNTLKGNLLKEKMTEETKIEANFVLKGVRGKIDDAKNQLSLLHTLEKLRKCRLQNCVNKRKNPLLEETISKLKILWQKKLMDYNKEEELKHMLYKAETEKHEKREIEIQEKLVLWDQTLFGPNCISHETVYDNIHTFLNNRRNWDKYVNENETSESSSIPVGWIIPSAPCNSDWAKYLVNSS